MLTYTTETGQKIHWSVERCNDSHQFFTEDNRPQPVTEAIIKCAISLGISKITQKSAVELFRRIKIHEYLNGPIMWSQGEPVSIAMPLVQKFVGAYHDGPSTTDSKFRIVIEKWVLRNVNRQIESTNAKSQPEPEPARAR